MITSLHPIEKRILSVLQEGGRLNFDSLVEKTSLNPDQVRRALQWLSTKKLVNVSETEENRLLASGEPPPELKLVDRLVSSPNPLKISELRAGFQNQEEFSAAFGRARSLGWIGIGSGRDPVVKLSNPEGPARLRTLLEAVSLEKEPEEIDDQQKDLISDLLKRGTLRREHKTEVWVELTETGRSVDASKVAEETIDRITPEVLISGAWRGKGLRPIDVEAKAPVFYPGRRHPVRDFIREVREVYVSMGFTELRGDSVNPAFWNFDALFIPQDHPGREMQDTFYLDGMSDSTLHRKGTVENVASAHENGWKTGSRGWGYTWRIEEARRLVLRTHNTVLTIRALSDTKEKETRVFAISKVYRNENLDYKHLAEFYQMDGIMVGKGLNVRHLMGFLTEFYRKLGMKEVKLWPTYFPYTEPSLEVVGYSESVKDWIELSGSGVFRPEVTFPLGVRVPVLAWGPGIERLMLMRFGLEDMRELYGGDLSWLRNRVELAGS